MNAVVRDWLWVASLPTTEGELKSELFKLNDTVCTAFDQDPSAPRCPVNDRERLAAALVGVAGFLNKAIGSAYGRRFFDLAVALADLNAGTSAPLLRAVAVRNRHVHPSILWHSRALVALALEALSGTEADALKLLAEFSQAKSWRYELRGHRVKNFVAETVFEVGLEELERLGWAAHKGFAERQLALARLVFTPSVIPKPHRVSRRSTSKRGVSVK